jgi:hypothetical protein
MLKLIKELDVADCLLAQLIALLIRSAKVANGLILSGPACIVLLDDLVDFGVREWLRLVRNLHLLCGLHF